MQMTFRWYGDGNDDITPEMIRQIPGVGGLVWALHDKQPGEIWTVEEIEKVRARIEGAGFHMDVVESVNVHDDIKIGLPTRDQYIENYKTTLKNLAKFGVKVVSYNFIPIFDWTRTDLFHPLEDGSNALYYEKSKIQDDYKEMAEYIVKNLEGLDALLLEANHDVNMLQVGKYPYYLKRRILGDKGHLSNETAGQLLCRLLHDNMKQILLGHLSRENNYEALAYETVCAEVTMGDNPYKAKDFRIDVAHRDTASEVVEV